MKDGRLIDNRRSGTVIDEIRSMLHGKDKVRTVSNFITLYAFKELRRELEDISEFHFLFQEPLFQGKANFVSKEINLTDFEGEFTNAFDLDKSFVARKFKEWIKKKAVFKAPKRGSLNQGFFHTKTNENQSAIFGTFDFSLGGLGVSESDQRYLVSTVDNIREQSLLAEKFDDLWDNDQFFSDVNSYILNRLELMARENEPELVYFFTLSRLFSHFVESTREEAVLQHATGFKETEIWKRLYSFQRDGVIGAINKIEKFNGCILADSVGLGKTFEALAVIKFYELRNNKVLVLSPKKLRENWNVYRYNDTRNILSNDRFAYDLLNHTDLSREKGISGDIDLQYINWGNYDLVVIDESHNFRNRNIKEEGQTRYQKLLESVVKSGVKTKVLLLSATPVNNNLSDLKHQIHFITEEKDNALSLSSNISSINQTIRQAQSVVNRWTKLPEDQRSTQTLVESLNWDYFSLLDSLTIARSRKHIEKYYDTTSIGKFPTRMKPINKKIEIDQNGLFPELESINSDILRMNMAMYTPAMYVIPMYQELYYDAKSTNLSRSGREKGIIHLMKSNLLKRLESSVNSFQITVKKMLDQVNMILEIIRDFKDNDFLFEGKNFDIDEAEFEEIMVGNKKAKVHLKHIDIIRWRQDLVEDQCILLKLYDSAIAITPSIDNKLLVLKETIRQKMEKPLNPFNKKIIIFTAFADTANYLYDHLHLWIKQNYGFYTAVVTGSQNPRSTLKIGKRSPDFSETLTYFSPKSKEKQKLPGALSSEIDVLIATDCISEGQNLQDCDFLINYDIHWNPVRIIQRFGRVDRLGSTNEYIQLVNYWPSMDLDAYINLEARVKGRMVALDISATGEDNVLEASEMKDLEYRRNQLYQLQEEALDLEEINGSISLTDFTLDDFRMDLLNLQEKYPDMEYYPKGIFSFSKNEKIELTAEIQPGIIFCFKYHGSELSKAKNPIYPYYLVYMNQDGEVIYTHEQAKKILDIYRVLCNGKIDIPHESYEQFYKDTGNGRYMKDYQTIAKRALDECQGNLEFDNLQNLFSLDTFGSFGLVHESAQENFELVSFLIIGG
ncbi:helicase-related protein [Priestia aryabhattai]|uniref:helicase-related protein n=1 Tax=Priestia aryabhattai TaxID=412384 RepID=UPI003D28EABC